jgi:hypothetical protein
MSGGASGPSRSTRWSRSGLRSSTAAPAQAAATINVWNRLAVSSYQDMPDMT